MPFLVRDVHGLSGLALANADPAAAAHPFAYLPPRPLCPPRPRALTSHQVHIDQVGFDVSRFLRLVPQTLRDPEPQGRTGAVTTLSLFPAVPLPSRPPSPGLVWPWMARRPRAKLSPCFCSDPAPPPSH